MPDILFSVENHIARLTMNRPEALNAFSGEMIRLWIEALEEVRDNDDIHVLLLSGNGRAFNAGGDVKAMAEGKGAFQCDEDIISTGLARKNALWKWIQRIPLLMQDIDKPTVAKIHGPAMGAGLDMALMCDIRIASDTAKMGESYLNVGLVPGDGGAYFLPRIVGTDRALDMFWNTRIVTGREAKEMGLVTFSVSPEDLDSFTENYVAELAARPQQAVRFTKRAVLQSERADLRTSLDMISSAMGILMELDDHRACVKKIIERMEKKK